MLMVPFFLLFCLLLPVDVRSQNSLNTPPNSNSSPDPMAGFQPTLAFVIAMLSIMFSITFMLLLYAKLCHRPSRIRRRSLQFHDGGFLRSWRRMSGLDKNVVESLPFFRFETLKGTKEGLECPVCLAKYEDVEILRLLPKCKHAFHIDCIDSWLEKHSTCPLCRRRVTAEDLLFSPPSRSLRFQSGDSDLYVRREDNHGRSSRLGIRDSKEEAPLCLVNDSDEEEGVDNLHKLNHEIVAAEPPITGRWSSMSSPDLILLSSEMITDVSRAQIPTSARIESSYSESIINIKEEIEKKKAIERRFSVLNHTPSFRNSMTGGDFSIGTTDKRSFSDITLYPRFFNINGRRSSGVGGRLPSPPQIEITPAFKVFTRNSTVEEHNRRAVDV